MPYQFYVDSATKEQALAMVGPSGMDLSIFMRMALDQFVERPLRESMDMLDKHAKRHRRKGRK